MKNIHILPTQNEITSKLFKVSNELKLTRKYDFYNGAKYQNIYITSDEEIKEEDWVITPTNDIIQWAKVFQPIGKKIILTTDAYLIKDAIQAIDDEFLEWFVKNPSCKEVEVVKYEDDKSPMLIKYKTYHYKIIIPKEEPKQETTLEKAAEIYANKKGNIPTTKLEDAIFKQGFIDGAKWQQEKQDCCTPANQIKRYVDCIGCDRKPKQMSKQSVVEWFSANAWKLTTKLMSKEITKGRYAVLYFELHEQAIKMEEEQIIDAASDHCYPTRELARIDAEQYYNETYKNK